MWNAWLVESQAGIKTEGKRYHANDRKWRGTKEPLDKGDQCSCLENPRDGEAWRPATYGVAQNWTQLKRLNSSSNDDCLDKQKICIQSGYRLTRN